MRRLIRITLKVLGVLLLIYFAMPIFDYAWYALKLPPEFQDSSWSGEWKSSQFSIISGRILAKLPDSIPSNQEFVVDAIIYYKIWTLYRPGSFVRMKMTGYFDEGKSLGGDNVDSPNTVPPSFTFSFKGGSGTSQQVVEYVATNTKPIFIIVGGYRSVSPSDIGWFSLEKR